MGNQEKSITVLRKNGGSTVLRLSHPWLKRLAWNPGDHLHLAVVQGALVVTKVTLPTLADLRKKVGAGDEPVRLDAVADRTLRPGEVTKGKTAP